MRARLHELHAERRETRTCSDAGGRQHPGEATFDKNRRLDLRSEEPAKLNGPFFVVLFLQDLFRAGELFIPSHLVYGRAEVLGRESRKRHGMEAFGLVFRSQQEANGRVGADFANGSPEGKEFFRSEEHARLMDESLWKSCPVQNGRGTESQFFQL